MRGYKAAGINIWAPPLFALLDLDAEGRIVPSRSARAARAAGLEIVTWTLERSGNLAAPNKGFYYRTIDAAVTREGRRLRGRRRARARRRRARNLFRLAGDGQLLRGLRRLAVTARRWPRPAPLGYHHASQRPGCACEESFSSWPVSSSPVALPRSNVGLVRTSVSTATGEVTEFALPHPASGPTTIALAPDGTVWFTQSNGNRIGRMNPDGTGLVEFDVPTEESSPRIIALGADGNIWFSEHLAGQMARITPAGEITEFRIPTPDSQPRAIALGADGNIWFGMFAAGKIGRITPAGVITEFDIPTPFSGPRALAAGPDGNIWFSEFHASKIGRITMAGVVTEFPLPRANSGPGDITAGADGNMWFIELNGTIDGRVVNGNNVGRITMRGEITEFDIPSPTGSPTNVAVGPDRNVWYTKGAALGRVTPDGAITEFPLPATARGVGLTAGSDREPPRGLGNRLWYADGTGNKIGYLHFE